MSRIVFIDPIPYPSSEETQVYLQAMTKNKLVFYVNNSIENTKNIIIDEYSKRGTRNFVLNLLSSDIIILKPLLEKYKDAKFVATISSLISLRNSIENLYFTSSSDVYLYYISDVGLGYNTCIVYDKKENPYVEEVINIFGSKGTKYYEYKSTEWHKYEVLVLVSTDFDIWYYVTENIPTKNNYTLWSLQLKPPSDIRYKPNITDVGVIYPQSTIKPHFNTYWNINGSTNKDFTAISYFRGVYTMLSSIDWRKLIDMNLISKTDQVNGMYQSKYIQNSNYVPKNNIINDHLHDHPRYVWLLEDEYVDKYVLDNIKLVTDKNPLIEKVKIVKTDIVKYVYRYYKMGYVDFILDASSTSIKKLQQKKFNKCVFFCTRATDPTIRHPNTPYLYGLEDDTTMIEDLIVSINNVTNNGIICVMGESNNINIEEYKRVLTKNNIKYVNVDNLKSIDFNTIGIISVGNDDTFDKVLKYYKDNKSKFNQLTILKKYGLYVSKEDNDYLISNGIQNNTSYINYNCCYPFLDSKYSELSRPLYLVNYTNFFTLEKVLFRLPQKFLFYSGCFIDL